MLSPKSRLPFALLLVTAAAVPAACSSKSPPPPMTPTTTTDAGLDAAPDAMPVVMGSASAPASAAPVASASASSSAAPPSSGTALSPDAMDAAIDLAIKAQAASVAPGMSPEGPPGRATLTEGQQFTMLTTLAPNRCYTIVGFSPAGQVQTLELKLMAPPFYNLEAGKSGANEKASPVIGKGKAALCPALPIPVAYRVDAVARKGAGRVGVYVFARNK